MSDLLVRAGIYRFFAERCRAPSIEEVAQESGLSSEEARHVLQRLHERHMIFLDAATGQIRMANPFSAIATDYVAVAGDRMWYANCAWDTLGIAAALDINVEIRARHPVDGRTLALQVVNGQMSNPEKIVYFPLPCRQWYDDLVYT